MNHLVPENRSLRLPALVTAAGERAGMRFLEFFAANMRNPHTRRAYARAADEFLAWCGGAGVPATRVKATARGDPPPGRLAGHRPGRPGEPGRVGARAPARRDVRANAGARS